MNTLLEQAIDLIKQGEFTADYSDNDYARIIVSGIKFTVTEWVSFSAYLIGYNYPTSKEIQPQLNAIVAEHKAQTKARKIAEL